jgi:hypothetical protein
MILHANQWAIHSQNVAVCFCMYVSATEACYPCFCLQASQKSTFRNQGEFFMHEHQHARTQNRLSLTQDHGVLLQGTEHAP